MRVESSFVTSLPTLHAMRCVQRGVRRHRQGAAVPPLGANAEHQPRHAPQHGVLPGWDAVHAAAQRAACFSPLTTSNRASHFQLVLPTPHGNRPFTPLAAAAIMVADVSGFTALTEALSVQGSVGVELLTRCMNRYFTQVGAVLSPGPDPS